MEWNVKPYISHHDGLSHLQQEFLLMPLKWAVMSVMKFTI